MYCTYIQFNIDKKCLQFLFTWIDIKDLDLKEIQDRNKEKKNRLICELILKLDNPPIFFSVPTRGRSRTCFFSRLQGHDCWIFFDKWSARPWQNPSFNFAIKSSQFRAASRFCSTAAQLSPKVNYTPHTATIHFDRVLTRMKKNVSWIFFDKWSAWPWQNPSFNFAIKSSQFRAASRFCSTAA